MQKRSTNEWEKAVLSLLLAGICTGPTQAAVLKAAGPAGKHTTLTASTWQSAEVRVTGRINSTAGEALPGVTVLVKGTNQGTTSNVDGTYALNVADENAVLVFSLIGYVKQEITVGNRASINISLEQDVTALGEVLVVGYGTQERKAVTGAVANVKAEQLLDRQPINVTQALQGRVAGVDVYTNTARPGAQSRVAGRPAESYADLASAGGLLDAPKLKPPRNPGLR